MERVHLYARCIPIPQGSLLFWSEFAEASIEYRYNYLFTHEINTGGLPLKPMNTYKKLAAFCPIRTISRCSRGKDTKKVWKIISFAAKNRNNLKIISEK